MARTPNALIPPPNGERIPDEDFGISERVETAAVLLTRMLPSQVAQRLVKHYNCSLASAYIYIASARGFLAGLKRRDQETWFHTILERLDMACLDPASTEAGRLKAIHLLIGMLGLRRPPAAPGTDPEWQPEEL